jgi:hypothetical protein
MVVKIVTKSLVLGLEKITPIHIKQLINLKATRNKDSYVQVLSTEIVG